MAFKNVVKEIPETDIPAGCAVYARLVLPQKIEGHIERLEFRRGSTGLEGGGRAVNEETYGHLGSSGKTITGLMATILEEGKHLRFKDSISIYFPKEVMNMFQTDCHGETVDPSAITVESLSFMTAGLTFEGCAGIDATTEEKERLSYDEILRNHSKERSVPFMARPGDKICTYSNLQMQLLAYIIEKAYKEKTIKTLLKDHSELAEKTLESLLPKTN